MNLNESASEILSKFLKVPCMVLNSVLNIGESESRIAESASSEKVGGHGGHATWVRFVHLS